MYASRKMTDPTDIRAEQARDEAAKNAAAALVLGEKEDLVWLMSMPRGRRVVWRLLERTGLHRSSFTGNSTTFFNEGARNVGLQIQALVLEHCAEHYIEMLLEQKDYRK